MRVRPGLLWYGDEGEEVATISGCGAYGGNVVKSFKGTKTEQNLLASFARRVAGAHRYTYFASTAKKAGLEQISAIFADTADNEKEHARRFFSLLQGGEVMI